MACDDLDFGDYFIITLKFLVIVYMSSLAARAYESPNCSPEWAVPPLVAAVLAGIALLVYFIYETCFIRRYGFLTVWQMLIILNIIASSNINNVNSNLSSDCDIEELNNASAGIFIPALLGGILFIFSLKSFDHYKKVIKYIEEKKNRAKIKKEESTPVNEDESNSLFPRKRQVINGSFNQTHQLKL